MPGDDAYTYPGSGGVLRNKLGIHDRDELEQVENALVSAMWTAYGLQTPVAFGYDYLCWAHREMFGELYEWAGVPRTVPVTAAGAEVTYCQAGRIDAEVVTVFAELEANHCLYGLDTWGFAAAVAKLWGDLTYIHPFRDGNTRSQAFYVSRLAEAAGHPNDWVQVDPEALRVNRIAAVNGFANNLADYLCDRLLA